MLPQMEPPAPCTCDKTLMVPLFHLRMVGDKQEGDRLPCTITDHFIGLTKGSIIFLIMNNKRCSRKKKQVATTLFSLLLRLERAILVKGEEQLQNKLQRESIGVE